MFGYIKTFTPNLRVREHELYRAIYCGLCRSMGKRTGCSSRLTLSYDFTFLAAVRLVLCGTDPTVEVHRCAASPFKVRPIMNDNPPLSFCAAAAAVLTKAKVLDDVNDSRGIEKLKSLFLLPAAKKMERRALRYDPSLPVKEIEEKLSELAILEKEGCPSLDRVSDCFGEALALIFTCGLMGNERTIAHSIGFSVGRIIYVLDAADDLENDIKKNNYNPLRISPMSEESLSCAVRLELSKVSAAVQLMDFSRSMTELRELIYNIIYEGIPKEADRIFDKMKCPQQKKGVD